MKKVVESNKPSKCNEKIGEYQKWFRPHLWPPISVIMKIYGNNEIVFTFL